MVNMLQSFLHMLGFGIVDGDNRLWIKLLQPKINMNFKKKACSLFKNKQENRRNSTMPDTWHI